MSEPLFRFVCAPAALTGSPAGWAAQMLREGEIALLGDPDLAAVSQIAHDLGQPVIQILRREQTPAAQEETLITYTEHLPLVWVAPGFSDAAQEWAHQRGPMTLLISATDPLSEEQRRTVERFVASLTRQSE